jgi:hypothetical protein
MPIYRDRSLEGRLMRIIARHRKLLIAAHDALCDEVAVHSRRPQPRAATVATLNRIAKYLGWAEKKEDPDA